MADGNKRAFTNAIDAYNLKRSTGDGSTTYDGYLCDFDNDKPSGNTLDAKDNNTIGLPASQTSNPGATPQEGCIDTRDSGGPLFAQLDSKWIIIGENWKTVYFGNTKDAGYGCWSEFEALDKDSSAYITKKTGLKPVNVPGEYLPEPPPMAFRTPAPRPAAEGRKQRGMNLFTALALALVNPRSREMDELQ
jgi:hypothetical protein